MKDFWSKYNTFGKILVIISFVLIIVGTFFGDIKTWIGFCAISCICDYIAFQYGSTKEYYEKVLANKMHKPSRNLFALFFIGGEVALLVDIASLAIKVNQCLAIDKILSIIVY